MSAIETQLILRRKYQEQYLVTNFDEDESPMPSIKYREPMCTDLVDPLYELVERFVAHKVGEHTNMSLTEFLDLPVNLLQHVMRVCERLSKEVNVKSQEALDAMEAEAARLRK